MIKPSANSSRWVKRVTYYHNQLDNKNLRSTTKHVAGSHNLSIARESNLLSFLWHNVLALRHTEPPRLPSYASKVPRWKSTLGGPQNPCLEDAFSYWSIGSNCLGKRHGSIVNFRGGNFPGPTNWKVENTRKHKISRHKRPSWVQNTSLLGLDIQGFSKAGNFLGVANLGDSGGRLRVSPCFTQAVTQAVARQGIYTL